MIRDHVHGLPGSTPSDCQQRRCSAAARSDSRAAPACSSTTAGYDLLADRLAPLVVERGFASFLDYYYLLKYDESRQPTSGRG